MSLKIAPSGGTGGRYVGGQLWIYDDVDGDVVAKSARACSSLLLFDY